MTDDTTVYVSRSGYAGQTYHTREDCPMLPTDPAARRTVERAAVEPHYSECDICAGAWE